MTAQSDSIFLLACWTVHRDRHLIVWTDGNSDVRCERQLEPRLMRLLCLLADSHDSVLTRDELITALWPRVVVNENSLTRAVSDLRRLLSPPDGSDTRFIQTVPKRGYRLQIRPETPAAAEPDLTAPTPEHATLASNKVRSWIPAMAACLLLTLSVLHQWYWSPAERLMPQFPGNTAELQTTAQVSEWRDQVIAATSSGPTLQPLLTLSENHSNAWPVADIIPSWQLDRALADKAVVAPAGDLIAYVDSREGLSHLNLRHMLSPTEPWTAFSTEEDIYHLQWSPLDAGLLFTVGLSARNNDRADYVRLMLLDLQTFTLHELYRREWPQKIEANIHKDAGSLT